MVQAICVECGAERYVKYKPRPRCYRCAALVRSRRQGWAFRPEITGSRPAGWQTQERNHNWKGGRRKTLDGYIQILLPPDDWRLPMAHKDRLILEHRAVMAGLLGRLLHPKETVHHRDGDKANNQPENLELWQHGHPQGVRAEDTTMDALWAQAERLHKSRLWKTGSVEQTYAVLCMGAEMGIGPTTALSNIQIAMGKPTLGAALVGALVQRSGRYHYTVTELTDQTVSIDFFDQTTKIGTSTFTMQDAMKAGLGRSDTWSKYGRNMLMARALTNGARWFTPGVLGGAVYDPEEFATPGVLPPPVDEAPVSTDAMFTPTPSPSLSETTIEGLLEHYSAEQIVSANGGKLPSTEEELRAVAERLAGEPASVG